MHRLVAIGLPRHMIKPFVGLVIRWVSNNGPEWTVKRIKAVKLYLINRYSDPTYPVPEWFSKNQSGRLSGILGSLVEWCLSMKTPNAARKRFAKVIASLNIYTLFTSESVTKSQLKKFMDGVNAPPPKLNKQWLQALSNHVSSIIGRHEVLRGHNDLVSYRGSPTKWAPLHGNMDRVRQDDDVFAEMRLKKSVDGFQLATEFKDLYDPVFKGIIGTNSTLAIESNWKPDRHLYGGEVHFLQEPGLKMRAIASPYRVHQLALKPIGQAIYRIVEKLPWDCTFDQSKAIPSIQEHLRSGGVVHSIDLTGATDYFPLGIQLEVLRSIFGNISDIRLIERISKSRWKSEFGDIQWQRGQPLGLFPSFGMFTLTHGLVLSYLSNSTEFSGKFYIVGDDVVILDDELYCEYIKFLDDHSCPYSIEKSISSRRLSEFAGKIITHNDVVPSYKWRKTSNDNFLDIARCLGPQSVALFTKRQKKVIDAVKHLTFPVGLNQSKPGSNLASMIIETDKLLSRVEKRATRSLVDLTQTINRNTYRSSVPIVLDDVIVQDIRQALDESALLVFSQTVVYRLKAIWTAFSDLPRALGLSPRLPPETVLPSRDTTLSRYERLLRDKRS